MDKVAKSNKLRINYISEKMNMIFFCLVSTAQIITVSTLMMGKLILSGWYGILVGMFLMVLAIPLHILGKRRNMFFCFSLILNSIANGFSISAYYTYFEKNLSIKQLSLALFAVMFLVLLFSVFTHKFQSNKIVNFFFALIVLFIATMLIFWIITGFLFFSLGFFLGIIVALYCFVFKMKVNAFNEMFRSFSFLSFGLFIIITLIVMLLLSEGDVLDGADFGGVGSRKDNKKLKK